MSHAHEERLESCPSCGRSGGGSCPTCQAETALQELGPGAPIEAAVRARAEAAFGQSLGDVRVHRDAAAAGLTQQLGAPAFSVAEHVAFAPGEYEPNTLRGGAMLAHELAHTMQYTDGGTPRADEAHESDASSMAVDAGRRAMFGGAAGGPVRAQSSGGLQLSKCDPDKVKPVRNVAPALPPGVDRSTFSVDQYIEMWEKQQGRKMTPAEREALALGCVGISAVNLGKAPPLNECFDTFERAQARRTELQTQTGKPHALFSKRFYSAGKDYTPNPSTGRVDMSQYNGRTDAKAKPGGGTYVNFDYGYYDDATGNYWHANHAGQPHYPASKPMKVYQSTPESYSAPLLDFDKQVFCVSRIQ
jgi:hypothetical protein